MDSTKFEITEGKNGKYGLSIGKEIIVKEPQYDYVKNIRENLWIFKNEGGYAEIYRLIYDQYGDMTSFEAIMKVEDAVKSVFNYGSCGVLVHTENRGDGFLDNKGRWILPIGYEHIYLLKELEKELHFEVQVGNILVKKIAVFSDSVWNIIE